MFIRKRLAYALTPGDAIGIFSPSCPATAWNAKRTDLAVACLEGRGYSVILGSLTGKRACYRSGSIQARADELNMLIHDPRVKCIMASSGGLVSNSILPYIDYGALAKKPKILVGYSDVTAVLLAAYARVGLITFYGPNLIPVFGEVPPFSELSWAYFHDLLSGSYQTPHRFPTPPVWTDDSVGLEEEGVECKAHESTWVTIRGGSVDGRLIGGNLNTLLGIFGSDYMPSIEEGDLLYLEDCRQSPESIERSFSLLEISGVFQRIGGLILGKHADYDDCGTGKRSWEIPMETLGKYSFPILADFDCSHTKPMLTLPLGCRTRLDADAEELMLLEPCVST